MKKWYLLRGVEYSTSFKFFLENQILEAKTGSVVTYGSRLEAYPFLTDTPIDDQNKKIEVIREIHYNLLNGKFGVGELIE